MDWFTIGMIILAVCAVITLLVIVFVVPAVAAYSTLYGARQDRNPKYKYFTPQEFGLTVEELPVNYRGVELYGAIYAAKPLKECKKLIIFSHGMGAGHCAYTTEIDYYAKKGYAVLAYDNYGCDRSPGKKILGFYAGAEAVIAAYIAAKSDERLKDMPVYLVGHSWGGYSVLCAAEKIAVNGVVAFSAFNSPARVLSDVAKKMSKAVALMLAPATLIFRLIKWGANRNKKSVKCIEKSGIPALLIWGKDDVMVFKHNSAACLASGGNITSLTVDGGHNPYNTLAAQIKLAELIGAHDFKSTEEEENYYSSFDWAAATEENEEIMQKTVDFIESL